MYELDLEHMNATIDSLGIKQKAISEKVGLSESALCLILQGKRKCEAGEYAGICKAMNVGIGEFLKPECQTRKECERKVHIFYLCDSKRRNVITDTKF